MTDVLAAGTALKSNTYHIQRLLGQGGFGAVYLAQDRPKNVLCAIKQGWDTSPGAQAQFAVEATILQMLSHPTLTAVTDHFVESTGFQYLVMEYVEGQDLSDLLEHSGPLPEDSVLAWMDQVLDAVAYLHNFKPRPVIHRDIKPANIRLLRDGQTVKLVDFGIAKIGGGDDKTRPAAQAVTPGFSPLEQYGMGTDARSDVYALGATLYNLLTNVEPPEALARSTAGAQLDPPRKFNPRISPHVEQVIMTAMELAADRRFPNAEEMRYALQGKRPTTVSAACPHCGAPVRSSARFCNACGQGIVRVAPFVFKKAGFRAADVKDLVRGCDTYWDEALDHFRRGDLDAWLAKLGPGGQQLAARAQAMRAKHSDPNAALEEFLQAAAPTRSLPILTVTPDELDYPPLRVGDTKVRALTVSNSGRGYLHGSVEPKPDGWIRVHPGSFGCLAGTSQQIDVEVQTAGLSGTELGVDYGGTVTVASNRGTQTVPVRVKVVDEPLPHLEPATLDLGHAAWGSRVPGRVMVSNTGGGTLHAALASSEPWLGVDPSGASLALNKGQSMPVGLAVDTTRFLRRGRYSARLQLQTQGRGSPVAVVNVQVDVPYPLDPAQPNSGLRSVGDLVQACDGAWEWALHFFQAGRIKAFLHFIGEDALAQTADDACRQGDPNRGLEVLLRAVGAPAPADYRTNISEVLGQLGFGLFARLGRKAPVVSLLLENTSRRGYLYGHVEPLAPWLTVPQPHFGCLPGQVAEVEIHAEHKAKKGGIFSLGTELFEIIIE